MLEPGVTIASVVTDKATMDWECQDDGFVAKLLVAAGTEDVPVGKVVAIMVEDEADVAAFASFTEADLPASAVGATSAPAAASAPAPAPAPSPAPAPAPSPAPAPAPAPAAASTGAEHSGGKVAASPLARRIARDNGVNISALAGSGTGWNGRIVRADVDDFIAAQSATPAVAEASGAASASAPASVPARGGDFVDVPHTDARRRTAALLTESKRQVPHYYLTSEICLDELLAMRARINSSKPEAEHVSVMDLIVKAAAIASRRVPEANSAWLHDAVRVFDYVDIAVSTNTDAGIVTPVVRDAHSKGAADISADLRSLTAAAVGGTLTAEEAAGATLTITNLGGFGLRQAAPVIHPPQAAHLAIGAATRRVVPGDGDEQWKGSVMFNATLSCDHRVLDGAVGAQWLAHFRQLLEDPVTMIL